jgi:hypothetical protein
MWEKDKMLLKQYRDCMTSFVEEINSGEEVDYADACAEESAKLALYIAGQLGNYQMRHPSALSEKKQNFYTPMMPYF